jgi:hypothetical protein
MRSTIKDLVRSQELNTRYILMKRMHDIYWRITVDHIQGSKPDVCCRMLAYVTTQGMEAITNCVALDTAPGSASGPASCQAHSYCYTASPRKIHPTLMHKGPIFSVIFRDRQKHSFDRTPQLPRFCYPFFTTDSLITMATEELCSVEIVGMYYRMLFIVADIYFLDSCYP